MEENVNQTEKEMAENEKQKQAEKAVTENKNQKHRNRFSPSNTA